MKVESQQVEWEEENQELKERVGMQFSSPPLPAEDAFQDPQWLPETTNSTEPYILGVPK